MTADSSGQNRQAVQSASHALQGTLSQPIFTLSFVCPAENIEGGVRLPTPRQGVPGMSGPLAPHPGAGPKQAGGDQGDPATSLVPEGPSAWGRRDERQPPSARSRHAGDTLVCNNITHGYQLSVMMVFSYQQQQYPEYVFHLAIPAWNGYCFVV